MVSELLYFAGYSLRHHVSRLRDGSKLLELQQEQLMVPLAPNLCETDLISELLGVTLGPKKAARKALIKN
jgi:hypothetical protein